MRAIVAVTDLTDGSDGALRAAGRMCARTGASLHVVHAAGWIGRPLREAFALLQADLAGLDARMDAQLRRTVPFPVAEKARCHLRFGAAPEAVRDRVQALPAATIVVGARGEDLTALVAAVDAPVLVVRDGQVPPFERVLVPVGDADVAARTLRDACAWLCPFEREDAMLADVHVLHVARRLADWRGIGPRWEAGVREVEAGARR
ncbi:MAG TPA: universal stress protein, partial [Longimicrobium sp.]|nr:universal stress protein [Longimicrobium sp.]